MYKQNENTRGKKQAQRHPSVTRSFWLRRKMALKHFWYRRRLRTQAKIRARVERYQQQNPELRSEAGMRLYWRRIFTIGVVVFSILGCGLLILPTIADEPSGIPGGTLDMFNLNEIRYWDPCSGGSGSSGGGGGNNGGGGANEVEGDDNPSKIWNWLVKANINKVSNDPAVLAGIMGNFYDESTYDPYIVNGAGCKGLWQVCASSGYQADFVATVDAGAGSYWGGGAPQSAIDKAIDVELSYLTTKNTGWQSFVNLLDSVTEKTPEGYATLFEAIVENSGGQGMDKRHAGAREAYERFGKNGAATTTGSSGSSSGGSSGSNNSGGSNSSSNTATGDASAVLRAKNADKQDTDFTGVAAWDDLVPSSIKKLLETYGDLAYQTGRAYGAPWQAILVQMRYEEPNSACNGAHVPNNFWGNGCYPGGTPLVGANLGEGFQNYGKTLTNGNHDQAIGIADPKEYLDTLAITWIGTGNKYGADASVDALQKYIDSEEGQEIVKTFTNYEGDYMNGGGSGNSDDDCVMGGSSSVEIDKDGWITSGPGYEKQDASTRKPGETFPTGEPTKIILHDIEGSGCDGINCYSADNFFPPHFTIDLPNKKIWQHYPLTTASQAVIDYDNRAIQIEIKGFWAGSQGSNEWDLANFSDENWDYLAEYLIAISNFTRIPLESTVDWKDNPPNSGPPRLSEAEFETYTGVLGHGHVPHNDHTDPGNIWDQVKAAIERAGGGGGEYCTVSETDICGNVTNTTSKPKSGSVSAFQEYVLKYAWPKIADGAAHAKFDPMPDYKEALDRAPYKGAYNYGDGYTDCGAFVQALIHDSGWDPSFYGIGATGLMLDWLGNPANGWEKITPTDVSQLKPGDVAVNSQHTWVFVGDIPGFESQFADASWGDRVPSATSTGLHWGGEVWFRKKGQ